MVFRAIVRVSSPASRLGGHELADGGYRGLRIYGGPG
jgi:hypothetical protein